MRLYRSGDTGEPIRDIQDRLLGLGLSPDPDARGEFREGTRQAVVEFQRSRGLGVDGIVGPDTWRALYEAGYRLGDRLLFLRRPMLRGDDVAELQSRLNGLGFDAGKVDGIFGGDTQKAILEFQRNRHLAEDGRAGPGVITELRLVTRATLRAGREAIRELEWLRERPTVVGARIYVDSACRSEAEAAMTWLAASSAAVALQERGAVPVLSRSHDVVLPERLRAQRANRLGADLIVSFGLADHFSPTVYYFSSDLGRSEVGARLAASVAAELSCDYAGRATPMLKETRAPAISVEAPEIDDKVALATVEGIDRFFATASGASAGAPTP